MKRVSVLGCGWLGKPLSISLLDEGYSVKGSTTSEEKLELLEMNNITPYIVNISEFEEFDSFLNSDILIISITNSLPPFCFSNTNTRTLKINILLEKNDV